MEIHFPGLELLFVFIYYFASTLVEFPSGQNLRGGEREEKQYGKTNDYFIGGTIFA